MNDHVSLQPGVGLVINTSKPTETGNTAQGAPSSSRESAPATMERQSLIKAPAGDAQLPAAIERLNEVSANFDRQLHFSIDENSGRTVVKVTDPETDELIRQIPAETALKLSASLKDMADQGASDMTGLFLRTET